MRSVFPMLHLPGAWHGKAVVRVLLLLIAAGCVAAIAAGLGVGHDYGYLHASILTGSPEGEYFALATHLAHRAEAEHGTLTVIPTAGSIENVSRLAGDQAHCTEMFGFIQDGTPVPTEARLELLGRLPEPESLLLLGKRGHAYHTFANLRGASVGIGPEQSGTAYLMRQIFADQDLRELDVRLSHHGLAEQAELVAEGKLDLAAFVIREDADFLRTMIQRYNLDIVAPEDFQGLIARYPWLSLGRIPAGRYDVVHPVPEADKQIARVGTLLVASPCAQRTDRIALLMLLGAELPGFVRGNPPSSTSSATVLPLAPEAHQFFLTGQPEIADRYFPWLVNRMSPAYWVYLVMAATVLFNALKAFSRFRLWRIDTTREKLETALKELVDPELTHAQMRAIPEAEARVVAEPERRAAAQAIMARLLELRARCQRQTSSFVTPMGDEMFYRYQQALIDEATTTLGELLQRTPRRRSAQGRASAADAITKPAD